ncbi:MAG: hypothetical protein ACK41Q_09045, partial [Candidatus Brocadia sp.]
QNLFNAQTPRQTSFDTPLQEGNTPSLRDTPLQEGNIKQLFEKVKNLILPIESFFVFGSNAENLKEIIKTLKEEKQDKNLGEAFILNPKRKNIFFWCRFINCREDFCRGATATKIFYQSR